MSVMADRAPAASGSAGTDRPDDAFVYRDGRLSAEGIALDRIAQSVGTPAYVYAGGAIRTAYRRFAAALSPLGVAIAYAVKANDNLSILRLLAAEGAGADVVSGGELRRVLAAGIRPERIIFAGVGKQADEIAAALDAGIHQFNVESLAELDVIAAVAAARGTAAPVALRINPDVDAGTHAKITTGRSENKFGIPADAAADAYRRIAADPALRPVGLAVHIGSQLTSLAPFRAAYRRIADLATALRGDGLPVERLDLGGGFGVQYRDETPPDPADIAAIVKETVVPLGCGMTVEPGRALVAAAGVLLARVLYVKAGATRRFVVLDAGMNDLLRPTLYDAWHPIVPVGAPPAGGDAWTADIVGPICETGDTFAEGRRMAPVAPGDLVAIGRAGAYGAVMVSRYNGRAAPAEVLIDGGRFAVVRKRPSFEETIADETVAPWLARPG